MRFTTRQRLETWAHASRVQSDEATYDLERTVVGSVVAGVTADRCGQCGACDRTVVPVDVGDRETGDMESVNEPIAWMVTNVDGQDAYVTADPTLAAKGQRALPLYTAHPDSYGHWDHAQISKLLNERDELMRQRDSAKTDLELACDERDKAESALLRHGYRKTCDIPACNCGDQWTHGGHAAERLREFRYELDRDRPSYKNNGKTILQCFRECIASDNEKDVLEKRLRAIVLWLEQNQPDVFRRGIWDAIGEVENGND